jgi:xylulokinase
MNAPCVLGIDLGTSSCKVCAVDPDGRLLGVGGCPYPILTPGSGWSEQDAREWMPAIERALPRLWTALGGARAEVTAIALSSAAHIPVLLDGAGEPLRPAILWNDVRSVSEVATLIAEMGDRIFAQTCNQASTTWSLPQLLWVRDHEPEVWRRLRRLCLSKDYLFHQLTGSFVTDPSTAVSSLLYDVRGSRWSEDLCGRLGISATILPTVAPADRPAGTLLPAVAGRLGLPPGLPVMPGTLDSVAETYSTGAVQAGACVIRLGTGGGVQLLRAGPVGHPQLISYPYPVAPLWLAQAATNACGASVEWAARALGLASPEALSALAATAPPGADGVLFHPYLSGERTPYWNGDLRGSFVGLSLAHGPDHLARAVLEGIAYSLKDAFSVFEGDDLDISGMTIVGGGAKSATLTRILCDVFARTVRLDARADSAYGAALLALDGPGSATRGSVRVGADSSDVLEPDLDTSRRYAERFADYRWIAARLGEYHKSGR